MRAETEEPLYRFEESFEECFKDIFVTDGIADTYTQRESGALPGRRVDVQFSLGNELIHRNLNSHGQYVPDMWNATLLIAIGQDRVEETEGDAEVDRPGKTNADDFVESTKKKIRLLLSRWQEQITEARLPYYEVRWFELQGASPTIETEDGRDVATFTFNLIFGIRADSWPIYTNDEQTYTASCPDGMLGNPVTATIPEGSVTSTVSHEDANAQALAQAAEQANSQLVCVYPQLIAMLPIINGSGGTLPSYIDAMYYLGTVQASLTLRIRGSAEAKAYTGGFVENGWRVGGAPASTNYNYYKLTISSPAQTYYLNDNAVQAGGSFALIWDYEQTIVADPLAIIRIEAVSVDSLELFPVPGTVVGGGPPAIPIAQPYNGQFFCVQVTGIQPNP